MYVFPSSSDLKSSGPLKTGEQALCGTSKSVEALGSPAVGSVGNKAYNEIPISPPGSSDGIGRNNWNCTQREAQGSHRVRDPEWREPLGQSRKSSMAAWEEHMI